MSGRSLEITKELELVRAAQPLRRPVPFLDPIDPDVVSAYRAINHLNRQAAVRRKAIAYILGRRQLPLAA